VPGGGLWGRQYQERAVQRGSKQECHHLASHGLPSHVVASHAVAKDKAPSACDGTRHIAYDGTRHNGTTHDSATDDAAAHDGTCHTPFVARRSEYITTSGSVI